MTTCYASGGETAPIDLRSTDGGQSWTSLGTQFVSMNGSGVACRSAQRCTISTPGNSVRWTTDGTNWTNASYNDPSGQDANRFLAVACPTDTICFLAADRGGVFKLDESAPPVSRSTAKANVGDNLNGISCPSPDECLTVGDEGQILETSDAGKTWSSERSGLVPKKPGDGSVTSIGTLRAATCDVSGACVAVGDSSSVATLAGPNGSWVSHSDALPTPAAPLNRGLIDLFGVSCDDAACIAVGSFDTIVRSTDGGATWAAVGSPAAKPMGNELHAVDCPGSGFCVAVGSYGHTLVSHDSGASWTEVQPSTPYSLNGVSCSSATDCVAVGSAGTVLRTSDGSQTWSASDSGTLGYLSSVGCPGAGYCTAVGQNGLALVSQDDGATWSRSDTGVDDGLDAVACQSPTACTATGSNGAVLRTGDAGQSWAAVGTGTERAMNGVACVGTVVCHAVGESAAVLEVADKLPVAAPDMTIADVAVNEGDSGLSTAPVTVSLSAPVSTGHEIDVSYATHAGTATAGEDYESVSGRLRFLQGESQKTISVPIIGDTIDEPDEDLTVVLSNPDGAFLARKAALVTIQNDDPTPSAPPSGDQGQPPAASGSNPLSPAAVGAVLGAHAESPPCKVPRLAGRRLVPALRLLSRTHCTIGRVAQRRSGRRAGIVIRQSPRRGAVRPGGTRVSLTVSSGRHK